MRTLDPKKHEELLRKKRDVATVKRGLRELYDSYPDAFELVARQMMLGNWRELLPPIVNGEMARSLRSPRRVSCYSWSIIGRAQRA